MLEQELEELVLKEKDLIPFLQKLTPKDKKKLTPFVKKLYERVHEYISIESQHQGYKSYTSKPTHSQKQMGRAAQACFVCLNKKDIKRLVFNISSLAVEDDYIENIIPWYKPTWYSDVINEDIPWGLGYGKMMRLYKKGLIEPSQALILSKLPSAILEYKPSDEFRQKGHYKPEALLVHPETLADHIWLFFEVESSINHFNNYLQVENYEGKGIWVDTFLYLVKEKKLDRQRVLSSTLYTATKGFNKILSAWFFDLLIKLDPSSEEVIGLQAEFFSALHSPHSKVVNTVLKYFKKLANHPDFKYQDFIENASVLLNAETKSVVNSSLMILEKIAQTHQATQSEVCQKVAEALMNLDKKIQLRAAKIIEKFGKAQAEEISAHISMYADSLYRESRELLTEYLLAHEENEEYDLEEERTSFLSPDNALPKYETLDDLIFFVSQALDNKQVYDLDLLLSNLPKLNRLLNQDNVSKLEPIFKRALGLSLSFEDRNSQIGQLEIEAACYLNDFAEILMRQYPEELKNTRMAKDAIHESYREDQFLYKYYKENRKEIEKQALPEIIYKIHRTLFVRSKFFIQKGLDLELLSTPTHAPSWIDPIVLIERIVYYEAKQVSLDLYDLQIALSRLPLHEPPNKLEDKLELIENETVKHLLKYFYGIVALDQAVLEHPDVFLPAILGRKVDSEIRYFQEGLNTSLPKELGAYDWDCTVREETIKDFDFKQQKYVPKVIYKKRLQLKDFNLKRSDLDTLTASIKSLFSKAKKSYKLDSIYNFLHFEKQKYYTTVQAHDDVKFLFLIPNNPGGFLSQVIHYNLKESTFGDEGKKKNMVNLLKGLYEIWCRPDYEESTYLFLATGLLCSDKVSRELAAEVWIKANSENTMDNTRLGSMLGKLEFGQYAPLKRFTDLLLGNLFNISKKHDRALFHLLDAMLGSMHETPIKGTKKLLEVYMELRYDFPSVEKHEITEAKLAVWKQTKSLKSLFK